MVDPRVLVGDDTYPYAARKKTDHPNWISGVSGIGPGPGTATTIDTSQLAESSLSDPRKCYNCLLTYLRLTGWMVSSSVRGAVSAGATGERHGGSAASAAADPTIWFVHFAAPSDTESWSGSTTRPGVWSPRHKPERERCSPAERAAAWRYEFHVEPTCQVWISCGHRGSVCWITE